MANFSDYSSNAGAQPSGSVSGPVDAEQSEYWGLSRLKKAYLDYTGSKRDEILEQQDARRYRHSSQWTSAQVSEFNKRKQPIVTYNRIAPKINGVVGLIERLRQAPKAYPRTPQEDHSADLATAVVRYVVDEQRFKVISPFCGQDAAVDGFSGIELVLENGDKGDLDVGLRKVKGEDFFYDPRSSELDFSDCRYMGVAKWMDLESAKEMFPNKSEELDDSIEIGSDLTTNSDGENKWFISDGDLKRVRIVDHWYKMNGDWCWCVYTGNTKLAEGKSPFNDEKGKTACKFVMFSANVDQDWDRYGFVRQFKSVQDEINQRRSKAMHIMNSRRILAEDGAFDDIEKARVEAVRPDGVVIRNKGFEAEFDDNSKLQDMEANLKFYQEAKEELDSYGPTLQLIGDTGAQQSGRAISLQQQAGIAQLGPFMVSYKDWKLRVYRAIWNAVKQHWTAERWIRVTDDNEAPQLIGLNQIGVNPQTGMPSMVNHVASLDVDIIMEEGPDSINMMQDAFDSMQVLVQNGAQVPPALLVEMSPLDSATKQRWIKQLSQPDPAQQAAQAAEIALQQAKVQETQTRVGLIKAQTIDTIRGDQGGQQGPEEHPAVTQANVMNTMADTELKKAQTAKSMADAMLAPQQQAHEEQKSAHDQQMAEVSAQQVAQKQADDRHAQEQQMIAQQNEDRNFEVQQKQAKAGREDEMHKATLAEKQYRLGMDVEKHKADMNERSKQNNVNDKALKSSETVLTALKDVVGEVKNLSGSVKQIDAKVDKLEAEITSPISIERDKKTGRVAGINKGSRKMAVTRDKDGRMMGAG